MQTALDTHGDWFRGVEFDRPRKTAIIRGESRCGTVYELRVPLRSSNGNGRKQPRAALAQVHEEASPSPS